MKQLMTEQRNQESSSEHHSMIDAMQDTRWYQWLAMFFQDQLHPWVRLVYHQRHVLTCRKSAQVDATTDTKLYNDYWGQPKTLYPHLSMAWCSCQGQSISGRRGGIDPGSQVVPRAEIQISFVVLQHLSFSHWYWDQDQDQAQRFPWCCL